jgi:hypothetical protein
MAQEKKSAPKPKQTKQTEEKLAAQTKSPAPKSGPASKPSYGKKK